MKVLVQKFYSEPIFALGSLSVIATVLVSAHVVPAIAAVIVVGIATGLQRQLVSPTRKR